MEAVAEHIKVPELRFPEFSGEWEEKRLGDLAEVVTGSTPSTKNSLFFDGPIPFVTPGDLHGGGVIRVTERTLTELGLGESRSVPKGSIFFSCIGNIGLMGVANCLCSTNQQINSLISRHNQSHWFTYYALSNQAERIESTANVQVMPMINKSDFCEITLGVPPLPEQQKIAEFLTAVDEKIGKLKRKKELLEAYKKGAMQKLFSQEIRFKDDQGNPYPDWEEKRLGDVGSKSKRKNKANQSLPVLTNSATQGVIMQDSYFDREITTEANLDGYYVVNLGLFVYNPRISKHAKAGPINLNNAGAGLMSPLYTVFSIDEGLKSFFKEYFKTTFWHRFLMAASNFGVRHDRMNVTSDDFFAMPLPFPSLPEQQKIAEFLTGIDDKINAVASQIDKAAEFKKGLLQKMFVSSN